MELYFISKGNLFYFSIHLLAYQLDMGYISIFFYRLSFN